jgi:hypothetical protein
MIVPACLALAACGGEAEEEPETQVVVPTVTASAQPADGEQLEVVEGYMLYADNERVEVLTQEGVRTYFVAPEHFQEIGVEHLASHAGLVDLAFSVAYEHRDGKRWIRGAQEISPTFPYDYEAVEKAAEKREKRLNG